MIKMVGRLTKLVIYNTLVFVILIILSDLILGDWKNFRKDQKNNASFPGLIKNRNIKYDARLLYNSKQEVPITYKRDENGYRSKEINSKKQIILTIGGSTTDQRYITEGETWQDYLDDAMPKFDFVNGGIGGQSTYGHIAAIKSWHSTFLKPSSVNSIIFLIGINDMELLYGKLNQHDKDQSKLTAIKSYIHQYSFIYPKFRKLFYSTINNFKSDEGINLAGHGQDFVSFKNERDGIIFSANYKESYSFYKNLFIELINETKKYFPKSKIIIIQQQAAGCKFNSKYVGLDIHLYKSLDEGKLCSQLASVYATQDEAIRSFDKTKKLEILPMYLQNIIGSNDVYDNIHTNSLGSKKIGEYIHKSGVIDN